MTDTDVDDENVDENQDEDDDEDEATVARPGTEPIRGCSYLGLEFLRDCTEELQLSIFEIRICNSFHGIVEMHLRLEVGRL